MKFRIKHIEGLGYFAQAKTWIPGMRMIATWKTIGKHPTGFGEYPESSTEYPIETFDAAAHRCAQYKKWISTKTQRPKYQYLDL